MKFTANEFPLAIDYKLKDKLYNASSFQVQAQGNDTGTTYPFDTQTIEPGLTWELPDGAEFIRKRELKGTA